jgi:glycosyltransferase involved in cell wall biosynthesis
LKSRTLVLSANTGWYLVHFVEGLIRGLKQAGYTPVIVAPDDHATDPRAAALGIDWVPIRIERAGVNPAADLGLLLEYRRVLKRLRPVAFLGFTVKPNIYGSLAAHSLGISSIANISGLGTAFIRGGPLDHLVTLLYRAAFRRRCTVFFQNPDDERLFVDRRIVKRSQVNILPGVGIDLKRFGARGLPGGAPIFLFVGRLLRDKGVREYVEAARILRRELPKARFQLLGAIDDGNRTAIDRSELESWAREGVIDYLGETDDVRPFIARAGAVVLPSYREGLPCSLLEAAAMARPLVATDVPGCREVVEDGVNGFLCAARDPESLADAMRRIAAMPQKRRQEMAAESRARVQERFSEQLVLNAYLDALDRIESA